MGLANGAHPGEAAAALLAADTIWTGELDDTLICRAVREETADVKTFVLAPRLPHRFAYKPGQFLTFEFEIAGETIHRCYTISSAPSRPNVVSITVKRVPGGPVSNWLHDHLKPGSTVKAIGPMGEFSCFEHPAEKYLFLSGGSGITPLMSMARTFHDLAEPRDIVFVHAARSPADIVFRDELGLMARHSASFRVAAICETDSPREAWGGFRGRLNFPMLELIAIDWREREIFVCGPAPFMAAVRTMLQGAGFDMARHHEESFDFATLSGAEKQEVLAAEAAPPIGKVYRVEFSKTRRVIECPEGMFVLEAARKSGVRLPSSCTKGLCGTCKSKLVSGTVELNHQGGIRQREIDAGMTLLCCAKPTSDLVVER